MNRSVQEETLATLQAGVAVLAFQQDFTFLAGLFLGLSILNGVAAIYFAFKGE